MRCASRFAALPALLLSIRTLAAPAPGDWPQWRGPNRDGVSVETGLLKEWSGGGPRLLWKATGLGDGYSTAAVAAQRIFVTGDRGDSSYVFALNGESGKQVWSAKLGKPGAPGWGGFKGPRATVTVDGSLAFAAGQYGELVCLDAEKGGEKWRKDYSRDFGGRLPEWGYAESPLADGDKVVVTPGGPQGAMVALNKETGALIWRSKELTDSAQYASAIAAEVAGVRQYILLTASSVAGVAAKDGRLLWRASRKGETAVIPTPIYHDGYVYVTSGYGVGCNLFKIAEAGGKFSAEQVYANKAMANHHGGAVLLGEHVYGHSDGKGWVCQELLTGKVAWQEKGAGKLGKGSIVAADGMLFLRAEEGKGTVAIIEATPQGYREKGRFDPPDRSGKNSWPHPVVAGGRLHLRDQDVLLCFDLKAPSSPQ